MSDIPAWLAKNAVLKVLFARVLSNSSRYITIPYIRELTGLEMTNQFVDVAVSALLSAGLVETDGKKSGKLGYSISADGIDWIQSGSQFDPNLPAVSDLWNEPDSIVLDNHSAVGQVRMHLSQCIVIIGLSQFTQEEKSQIVGLIRICEQIIDLPTPKVGLLRQVLGWLKDVKDIAPLVEFILKLTGKLP